MIHRLILATSLAALAAPLLAIPAVAQNWNDDQGNNPRGEPPAFAGRSTMMRAGPEAGYPQVRRIEQGQQMMLFGCLDDRSWCDVGYGNDRGWVPAPDLVAEYGGRRDRVVNLYGNFGLGSLNFSIGDYWDDHYRQQPFYGERYRWEQHYFDRYQSSWGPRPGSSYWGNHTVTGFMLRRAWLRAGPDADYPRVGIVYPRSRVLIHGCLRDWSWCDISNRANRGWVSGVHISGIWQGRQQAIPAIAPYLGVGILSFSFGNYWDSHYRTQPFYRERDRWERQYAQNYRPTWGAGPYQNQQVNPQRRDRPQAQRDLQRDRMDAQQQARRNEQREWNEAQQQAHARKQELVQARREARRERMEAQADARKQDADRLENERKMREPRPKDPGPKAPTVQ